MQEAAPALLNTVPAICVFFKPRMTGTRYVKELADRVVITWSLTEPYAGIQDFTWFPTVNRFQAVLHKDGSIEMSYDQMAAKDAIVGLYPMVTGGAERKIANLGNVQLSVVDGLFLKVTFETGGAGSRFLRCSVRCSVDRQTRSRLRPRCLPHGEDGGKCRLDPGRFAPVHDKGRTRHRIRRCGRAARRLPCKVYAVPK